MSALSIDSSVSLLEPVAAPASPARRGRPSGARSTVTPTDRLATPGRDRTPALRVVGHRAPTAPPRPSRPEGTEAAAGAAGHGRRAVRSSIPRARRASAASTLSPSVVAGTARLVAVRALGTGLAAAAVTAALASKAPGADAAALASSSVRGLAVAAILCAAWGFQDRPRLGTLLTVRAWYGTAVVIGLAHALALVATMPGGLSAHLAAAAGAFVLDAVIVAAPALLGARAGRPQVRSTLA